MRSTLHLLLFAMAAALLAGCPPVGDDDDSAAGDDDDAAPTTGTLAVSFRIDEDWAAEMDEPAIGGFWGSIYLSEQVSGIGPDDDAEVLGDIHVETVDMTGDDFTTGVLHVTDELPAGWVVILGFVDSDGNSTEDDRGPEDGDPVTLPNDNQFEVIAGEESPAEVFFNFLNP